MNHGGDGTDEESAMQIPTNRSENRINYSSEMARRGLATDESLSGPQKASTMPVSAGNLNPTEAPATVQTEKHEVKSQDAELATTESPDQIAGLGELEESGPRRRKGVLQKLHLKSPASPGSKINRRNESGLFKKDHQKFTLVSQIRATVLNSPINVLLVFVPVGIALNYTGISRVAVFVVNFLAIIPLAAMLSFATEEIALRVGETLGGLLNATFGFVAIY